MKYRMTCTAAAVAGLLAQATAQAQTTGDAGTQVEMLDVVDVTAQEETRAVTVNPADFQAVMESTEILRQIPGVDGSRLGGHGTDPVIRGQSQNRINILLDGAYTFGGCPNRMDPPTAYAPPTTYESIRVLKGLQTLEYGAGGAGGTVLFERVTPRFTGEKQYRGLVEGGYRSNGDGWDATADLAAGSEMGFGRIIGSHTESGNYTDGNGDEVRSAFRSNMGAIIAGWTPDDRSRLEFSAERIQLRDELFAGAGMDSPSSDNDIYRLKYTATDIGRVVDDFRVEIFRSDVEHVMDNYTLREPVNPMMLMRAPSTSDTTGGNLVTAIDSRVGRWKLGINVLNNDRDAIRINDFNHKTNSLLWPGVSIDQRGAFAELLYPANNKNRIIAGLRYDYVRSDASKADVKPDMPPLSPNELYAIYYDGAQAKKRTEHNWGGLLRWEHDLDSGWGSLYAGISRTVRTADATERFIASNAMVPGMRWVGNPLIDPEKHHQVEVGAVVGEGPWQVDASVYYNDVSDYILRWRYHQPDNNATVYKNVDARLIGGEATLSWRLTDHWQTGAGIAYVWANNDTDDLPIAQIPPFSGFVSVDYLADKWQAGARVNAAAQQNRVDDDPRTGSGLDTGETAGWAVVGLYGRYAFSDSVAFDAGIDNLFDKAYANHLNRANAFDPVQVQVNEPGRSFWARLTATF